MSTLSEISEALIDCDEERVPELVNQAVEEGIDAKTILTEGLLAGMTEVGRLFKEGEYFVPEVLIAAEAMKAGTTLLKPLLMAAGIKAEAKAAIGTVKGDLHDIGKNLVATMLEGAGFEIIDLGVDVPPEKFLEACEKEGVQLVAMSALLTTTMPMMEETVKMLREKLAEPPMIMVGGAPITDEFAKQIGADGYGRDAASGAEIAKSKCFRKAS